ncbi:MAG: hypothetical protein KatS3mg108_1954 [Isosphaeraceae bacterium]|jgi:hypothetical protein|nr:MAG: hypothetical protein KatS3mg108_1954 [Isosphaeraceae bacterium]
MRQHMIAVALVSALSLVGCEGDPADINNSVKTGEPPKPGAQSTGGGGTSEMARKSGSYPMPKGATPPGSAEAPKPADEKASDTAEASEPAGTESAFSAEELENIAKLPPEDQELAKAQRVCLISGEPLGSMGVPVRVEHNGEVGFLCCAGCKADFEKDPEAALAKRKK